MREGKESLAVTLNYYLLPVNITAMKLYQGELKILTLVLELKCKDFEQETTQAEQQLFFRITI